MIIGVIFVISDDAIFTVLITAALHARGYIVRSFATSAAGLAECNHSPPDLVLLKYAAFDEPPDAYIVCQRLRRKYQALPIIFITPKRDKALRTGASVWFDVVFDITEILTQTDTLIHHPQKREPFNPLL